LVVDIDDTGSTRNQIEASRKGWASDGMDIFPLE
jgi:hypothetical protein